MKKVIFALMFLIFFASLINAEIIINNQPNKIYNLGDSILIPITIKSLSSSANIFNMDLICDGTSINFYKNGISLNAGEEKKLEASLILTKSFIGETKGICTIKGTFGSSYVLTQEFALSNKITLSLDMEQTTFKPGESIAIKGKAIKENGVGANGFVNLEIKNENKSNSITQLGTIKDGFFSVNITLPKDMEAKKYLFELNAYEKEGEVQTNIGTLSSNIEISQIPIVLEAIADESIEPGTNAHIKGILHDQTGKNIDSTITISIKNNQTKLVEKFEKQTNEILEFPIKYNEKPSTWKIEMQSNELTDVKTFLIKEKKEVNISVINNFVTVTNVGNVPYKESITVKIGDENIFIDVNLDVDESKEYKLTAPDGEYDITILKEGEEGKSYRSFLTGKAVSAGEKRTTSRTIFSFAWIFILLILLIVVYLLFRKTRKKTFFGRMPSFSGNKGRVIEIPRDMELKKNSQLTTRNKAEISLSIAGEKQKSTLVCLSIKNFENIKKTKGNAEETIQKMINFAESCKALTYENQNNLFFILSPAKTKTFRNEPIALQIAQGLRKALKEHNRLFKQKIDFGISINNGMAIIKPEKNTAKFMGLGNIISSSKRIANISKEEILFSEEVKNNLTSEVKAEKLSGQEGIYFVKEFKTYSEENKRFLDRFVKGLGKN